MERRRSVRCHAIQVSTVPKQQVAGAVGVGQVEQVGAAWWPTRCGARRMPCALEHEAGADGAQVLPAEAGADAARRWRGPTRSSTPAGWRCRRRRPARRRPAPARATSSAAAAMAVGVELDEAGHRRGRAAPRGSGRARRWRRARTTAARTPLVPTSTTRIDIELLRRRSGGRVGRGSRAEHAGARTPSSAVNDDRRPRLMSSPATMATTTPTDLDCTATNAGERGRARRACSGVVGGACAPRRSRRREAEQRSSRSVTSDEGRARSRRSLGRMCSTARGASAARASSRRSPTATTAAEVRSARPPAGSRATATSPNGAGRPSLPGLRMPFGSRAAFSGDQHVEGRRRAPRPRTGPG